MFICSDSRIVINAVAKTIAESSVIWLALNTLGEANRIIITWVPGYQGIHGNEKANGLAKLGTLDVPAEQVVGVLYIVGKNLIKDFLKREHLALWKKAQSCL